MRRRSHVKRSPAQVAISNIAREFCLRMEEAGLNDDVLSDAYSVFLEKGIQDEEADKIIKVLHRHPEFPADRVNNVFEDSILAYMRKRERRNNLKDKNVFFHTINKPYPQCYTLAVDESRRTIGVAVRSPMERNANKIIGRSIAYARAKSTLSYEDGTECNDWVVAVPQLITHSSSSYYVPSPGINSTKDSLFYGAIREAYRFIARMYGSDKRVTIVVGPVTASLYHSMLDINTFAAHDRISGDIDWINFDAIRGGRKYNYVDS